MENIPKKKHFTLERIEIRFRVRNTKHVQIKARVTRGTSANLVGAAKRGRGGGCSLMATYR